MARRVITHEMYDAMLQAFREQPGNASYAARAASCERRMAARAWEKGWPAQPWARPIRDVLTQERIQAKARQFKEQEQAAKREQELREKAKQEAIDALAAEGQMLKLGRSSVTSALAAAGILWPAIRRVAEELRVGIEAGTAKLTDSQKMAFIKSYTWVVNIGASAASTLIEAERRHQGEPTEVVQHTLSTEDPQSLKEAMEELERVQEILRLAKENGLDLGLNDPPGALSGTPESGPDGSTRRPIN